MFLHLCYFGCSYARIGTFRGTEVAIKTWMTASGASALDTMRGAAPDKMQAQIQALQGQTPKKAGWRDTATAVVRTEGTEDGSMVVTAEFNQGSESSTDKASRKLDKETMEGFL